MSIAQCLTCPHRRHPCDRSDGACPCKIDAVDIQIHVRRAYCPHPEGPRFGGEKPADWDELPRVPDGPGDNYTAPPLPDDPAIPRDRWPLAARIIAKMAAPEDAGLGDTIARKLDPLGGDIFKRWYKRITGSECSCTDRQGKLNAMYPYTPGNE